MTKLLLHVEMKVFIEMCIVICIIYRFLHQWSEWSDCRSGQSDCYYLTLPVSVNNTFSLHWHSSHIQQLSTDQYLLLLFLLISLLLLLLPVLLYNYWLLNDKFSFTGYAILVSIIFKQSSYFHWVLSMKLVYLFITWTGDLLYMYWWTNWRQRKRYYPVSPKEWSA